MGIKIASKYKSQSQRLKLKTLSQQLKQNAIQGTGMSPWEAEVLCKMIEDAFLGDSELREIIPGQMQYCCVADTEGPGKPLKDCAMKTVTLTLLSQEEDNEGLEKVNNKTRQQQIRYRRLMRICDQARDQGGLLTHEDLSTLLMCDVKTIGRDVKSLNEIEIILPTRGQQKDIGPGLTHRELIARKWMEGHEETAICNLTKHSMKAVENYLQTFKRVVFLRREKNFSDHEIAMVTGSSTRLIRKHLEIFEELKNHGIAEHRMEEICLIGSEFYREKGEKKDFQPQNSAKQKWSVK
ncbi:MAG: DUF1670 domain-containing protein [Crocinitomicaceae bacterium]|nr:DUF1670 domain-containing protein [Crocinitomicaceae bacterium]